MRKRYCVVMSVLLVAVVTVSASPDRAPYVELDATGEPLRSAFNEDADKVRLVMYVAPTCGGCLRGADRTQKDVLSKIRDDDLEVYVVWVPKNNARERHVQKVLGLVTDSRATQYWDGHGTMIDALDGLLDIGGSPCAGAFLLYGPDTRWGPDAAPQPVYWQDAHPELERSEAPTFDTETLAERVRALLDP